MSDILVNFRLTSHFSNRFKLFLLFLDVINNHELSCQILAFLSVRDLLEFTSCSSHFRKLTNIEAVQIRLLRAKLDFYEKPKVLNKLDFLLHYYSNSGPQEIPMMATDKMSKEHEALEQFQKGLRFFNYLKKGGIGTTNEQPDKQQKKKIEPTKIQFQLSRNEVKLQKKLMEPTLRQEESALARENHLRTFRNYQKYFQNRKSEVSDYASNNRILENEGKTQFIPYIPTIEELEYNQARQDYERRKIKRLRAKSSKRFVPYNQQVQQLQKDLCSRQDLARIYEDELSRKKAEGLDVKSNAPINRRSQIERNQPQLTSINAVPSPIQRSLSEKVLTTLSNMFRRRE